MTALFCKGSGSSYRYIDKLKKVKYSNECLGWLCEREAHIGCNGSLVRMLIYPSKFTRGKK